MPGLTGAAHAGSCRSAPQVIQAARIMLTRQPCGPMSRRFHNGGTGTTSLRLLQHVSNCCQGCNVPADANPLSKAPHPVIKPSPGGEGMKAGSAEPQKTQRPWRE